MNTHCISKIKTFFGAEYKVRNIMAVIGFICQHFWIRVSNIAAYREDAWPTSHLVPVGSVHHVQLPDKRTRIVSVLM